ncbi:MAG: epoxyqueuosine reductase [Deltaproteobacteria bacterium]|nr:epoxyqueuosine reductase [Deltaproteobacteria bacterium]
MKERNRLMDKLRTIALDYVSSAGGCAVGIATTETLAGGPPSTDLSFVLPGAESAVVFAVPLDQTLIEPFLGKKDRLSHERDNFQVNYLAGGIALGLADFLRQRGCEAKPVSPNNVYRPEGLKAGVMLPDISLRYLAVRAGIAHFGLSGNVITRQAGAAVILGAVITVGNLAPTEPLPDEDNYCDECRLCMASCGSDFMDQKEKDSVTLGGREYTYSKRRSQLRCQFVCGGFSGLHKSGKWSSWSPGRWRIPETDEDILSALRPGFQAFNLWPEIEGGQYHVRMRKKLLLTCGNCQLICHPNKEIRRRRHKLLLENGVVVQRDDGLLEALPPEEARSYVDSLRSEVKAVYGVAPTN